MEMDDLIENCQNMAIFLTYRMSTLDIITDTLGKLKPWGNPC